MDLPYTPKFFKKVELYQEIRRLDGRNKDSEHWPLEKVILHWAHDEHFHLASYLSEKYLRDRLKARVPDIEKTLTRTDMQVLMGNLVEHGWAEWSVDRKIKINRDGMLIAEVVGEVMQKRLKRSFYFALGTVTWVIFAVAFFALLATAWPVIKPIYDAIAALLVWLSCAVSLLGWPFGAICWFAKKAIWHLL